jgi:hypothetical chaperone protein
MAPQGHVLGIDFGTSNSAAGYMRNGKPHLIDMGNGENTLPTTFFFDFDNRRTLVGQPANLALLDGIEGRFMRALKRVLGTTLMHEKRQILNERLTFVEIIARFLKQIKTRAESQSGLTFDRVLSGRPVVFHGENDPREAQAEADLRACYIAAGFKDVKFMAEPEAAAIACGALDAEDETGLIVDIGGGTSDFSVFKSTSEGIEILINHGVRIGGTDFDRAINIDRVMPKLGKATRLRNVIGAGFTQTPAAIFNDLATWEKIPFLYTAQIRRSVDEMLRLSEAPRELGRLATVLEDELGHELAFAVERGKISANSGDASAAISLTAIERGLNVPLPVNMLSEILNHHSAQLRQGAATAVALAEISKDQIDRIIYVGGSSLMAVVSETMQSEFPNAHQTFSEVFTAVADGLAIAAGRTE